MISVLLLHGFCLNHTIWDNVIQNKQLKDIHFIVPDIPSITPVKGMDNYSNYIDSIIIDQKVDKFIFLGHSLGGYIALDYASKFPSKLLGLGLIHSHPFEDSEERKKMRYNSIKLIQTKGTYLFLKQMIFSLFTEEFINLNPLVPEKLLSNALNIEPVMIIDMLESMIKRKDHSKLLSTLDIPYLFFNGKNDPLIPIELVNKYSVLTNASKTIRILDTKSAHMSMFESHDALALAINQLVSDC
jgi:pimeloyl-ACP methyl ester carboxylesterase